MIGNPHKHDVWEAARCKPLRLSEYLMYFHQQKRWRFIFDRSTEPCSGLPLGAVTRRPASAKSCTRTFVKCFILHSVLAVMLALDTQLMKYVGLLQIPRKHLARNPCVLRGLRYFLGA